MADLQRLRDDFGYFAATARGEPLAGWQAADMAVDAPFVMVLWTRQAGKSHCLALRALWKAFGRRERLVLIVSGGGEAGARRLMIEARRLVARSPVLRASVTDEQANVLVLSNGSMIRAVAASESAIRGWSADELLIDESQLVPDDLALSAALPVVAARPGASIVAAGTASVSSGWFYDLCKRAEAGEEGVRLSRRVSRLVGGDDPMPWQSPTLMAAMEKAMGPLRADAELRCRWSSGADAFVTRAVLDRVTADFRPATLATLAGPARVAAGVDWGWRRDRTALVALARVALAGGRLFAVAAVRRWDAGHPLPGVVEEVARSPAHFHALTLETNGLGGPWAERLHARLRQRPGWAGGAGPRRGFRLIEEDGWPPSPQDAEAEARRRRRAAVAFRTSVVGVHLDSRLKAGGYASLRSVIEDGLLAVPASEVELRRELLGLRVTLTEGGERVEGASDDLADALMLAMRPTRFRDGRYGTLFGLLADPRRHPPAADLGDGAPGAGGWVESAGGLRLPREPAWQSVEGREVTAPGAPAPTGEDLEAALPEMRAAT